jgi:hypothetical protein
MNAKAKLLAAVVVALPAMAQDKPAATAPREKQKISYRASASTAKYTQQHVIEVGDVPGHQIRLLELQRTFPAASGTTGTSDSQRATASASSPADTPIFNGVRATEQWARAVSDYVDANGRVFGYVIFNMENGDKIFGRYEGLSLTAAGAKTNSSFVFTFTGGTGKFKDLRGTMRGTGVVTFAGSRAGSIETQYDGEYWFEK